MKHRSIWLMMLLIISCTARPSLTSNPDAAVTRPADDSTPTNEPNLNPFAPQPGDENLSRGNVYIHEASLVIRESYPPQISLSIKGDLPTPCHKLRVQIDAPDQDNKIMVEVYSLVNPDKVCIQVLESFDKSIGLGVFANGHYSVWVNGKRAGEFDV